MRFFYLLGLCACSGVDMFVSDASGDGTMQGDAMGMGDATGDAKNDAGDAGCAAQLSTKDAGPVGCGASVCNPPAHVCCPASSTCQNEAPIAMECDGGTAIECEINGDCNNQPQVCCLGTTTLQMDPICATHVSQTFTGTECFGNGLCPPGHVPACQQQSDCKKGTCTAFRALGRDWGGCF